MSKILLFRHSNDKQKKWWFNNYIIDIRLIINEWHNYLIPIPPINVSNLPNLHGKRSNTNVYPLLCYKCSIYRSRTYSLILILQKKSIHIAWTTETLHVIHCRGFASFRSRPQSSCPLPSTLFLETCKRVRTIRWETPQQKRKRQHQGDQRAHSRPR